MKETVYVLYDNEAQLGLKPFIISKNDVVPIRELQELANDDKSIVSKHPTSFQLVAVAEIDLETLEVTALTPRVVTIAVDLQQPLT